MLNYIYHGVIMGYLVCNMCGGYYELKNSESPHDYDENCECGGTLGYVEDLDETYQKSVKNRLMKYLRYDKNPSPFLIILSAITAFLAININSSFTLVLGVICGVSGLILLLISRSIEKNLDLKYRQLIYFLYAIQFLALGSALIVICFQDWFQVHATFRTKGTIALLIFLAIISCLSMILKMVDPETPPNKLDPPLN